MDSNSGWAPRAAATGDNEWRLIDSPQAIIGYWLRLADRGFAATFRRTLKRNNLIASEWLALRELYRPGRLGPTDLARALGMTKGGVTKLVNRLVKKGLAKKEISDWDRRYRPLELTATARQLIPMLARMEAGTDILFTRRLSMRQRGHLIEKLKQTLGVQHHRYLPEWLNPQGLHGQWIQQIDWLNCIRSTLTWL